MKNLKKWLQLEKKLNAASKVIKSGQLSFFWEKKVKIFFEENVQKFEKNIENFYKVKHAISVNSWTSGLICAVGALI